MNYTRTALGLLSAQYRSVLKKCFLINLGLFAFWVIPANASIDDYKGVEYTGKGTAGISTPIYFKWEKDDTLNIYKLTTATEATEADITTNNMDRGFFDDDNIPGYDVENRELVGVLYGDTQSIAANNFLMGRPDIDNITVNGVYVGGNIDNVRGDYVWPIAGAISTNVADIKAINGKFIGNSIKTNVITYMGPVDYFGAAYGGAIYNSSVNHYAAIAAQTPTAAGIIGSISGEFIANGVTITSPTGQTPIVYMDDYDNYRAYFTEGAFGGAIANQFGTIGAINNAVFENNYAISTATSGSKGYVGGAGIYNSSSEKYWWRGHGFQAVTSSIGSITADFTENVANTAYGDVRGGTILNMTGDTGIATIGNINGNFTKNSAVAQNGDILGSVIGNVLLHKAGTLSIGTISGTFKENTATASGEIDGLIFNNRVVSGTTSKKAVIAGIENAIFDKNTGSADSVYGGVISNYGEITNGIKNTTFTDNTFTATNEGQGAAIYTDQDLTISADGTDKKTLFKGNKINDDNTAVYADNADLTIAATNSGTVTFYDAVDGENANVAITGDASGKVQLYNDIKNSDVTVENVHIETTDDNGESRNYQLKSLTSAESAKYKIDFDLNAKTADTFETADPNAGTTVGTASSGRVTLEALKLSEGQQYSDITDDTFKVQVLKTQGTTEAADLQLALTDALKTELATKFVMNEQIETVDDAVTADTKWSDEFMHTVTTTQKKGWLGLATTATLNDSIGISTETTVDVVSTKRGDTLALVNQADLTERNFNADQATYKVSDGIDNIGVTHAGTMNVNGVSKDESVLDGNGAKLFDLSETGTTVSLNNVKVTNAATVATLSASDAKLNLNNAEISGNSGEITANVGTIEAVNTNFYDNSGTEAGAIVSGSAVKIIADNGTSEIKGNIAGQAASADTAIYMKSNPTVATTPQLSIEAKNNGTFTLRDSVDGDAPYAANITGDTSGTVQLYNDVKNADLSVDTVNVELNDGTVKDYSVNTLTSDASAKWTVDVDVENQSADRFITAAETPQSGSVVTLEHFEQQNGDMKEVRDENFKVQILKTQGSAEAANLQLALSDDAKAELGDEFVIKHTEEETFDVVGENTNWSDLLYKYTEEYTKYGQLGLATTDTLNDSIGVNTREEGASGKESLGDTLKLVNQAKLSDKNFTANAADEVYTLQDDLGETYGNLTIKGITEGEQKSTIDLNGHDNFVVPESASLALIDVTLKGDAPINNAGTFTADNANIEGEIISHGTLTANVSNLITLTNDGTANLNGGSADDVTNNSDFIAENTNITTFVNNGKSALTGGSIAKATNNFILNAENTDIKKLTNDSEATLIGGSANHIINSGVVNLTNTEFTSIDGNDGVVNIMSDIDLSAKKINRNALILHGIKATTTANSFGENVDLVAETGSEVNVGNNLINLRQATFNKGSQLTLNVDNLQTFGGIRADNFDIANGAKIDITFGQNPLGDKKYGEVALLGLRDGSDIHNNNFTDDFHNNMYSFVRKSEKSGIYGVYQDKTAREISEENGGTGNNQDTAGAWVDGPSHPNQTAQKLADDLARLAQTDGDAFNRALTALAPNDDGMAQSALIDLTDRLLLTVDNHLINSFMESGLASGDSRKNRGYPDLKGVKTWIKTYYAKSKMKNHGEIYGYDAKDKGFIAGVDKKIAFGTKVGVGVQYDDTDVDAFQRDVNIQTLQGYVYGEYRPSNWFTNGVLSYGTTDYDEDKYVIGHKVDAHYKANLYSVQGLTGYTFKYFTPELGARYYRIKRHGYIDGAMQKVSGNDLDLLRTTLGVKFETTYNRFKPNAYLGVMYDVISDSDDAVVSLGNGESYTINGKRIPRFGVELGVGSTIVLSNHIEIGVGYEAKFREKYQDHSGWASLKYTF